MRNQIHFPHGEYMAAFLFITDFDGTLLNDERQISRKNLCALSDLKKRNVITAIATGRSIYSFNKALKTMSVLKDQDLPFDYIMVSTGAGVLEYQSKKIIYKKSLSADAVEFIATYFDRQKIDYMIHQEIPDTHKFHYKSYQADNRDFYNRVKIYNAHARPLISKAPLQKDATQVLAVLQDGIDHDRYAEICRVFSEFSVIHATSPLDHKSSWIEIFHKDVSKSKTAGWLSQKIGIKRQNTIAVGNDYNDQDLLVWAAKGYIAENGPLELRNKFKVVASNNNCGVAEAIKASEAQIFKGLQ